MSQRQAEQAVEDLINAGFAVVKPTGFETALTEKGKEMWNATFSEILSRKDPNRERIGKAIGRETSSLRA